MRKFYKKGDDIYEFESDGSQDHLITDEFVKMTAAEIKKHLNPPVPEVKLQSIGTDQLRLALLNADLIDDLELAISNIEDEKEKRKIQIYYEYTPRFERDSEAVLAFADLLKLDEKSMNNLWLKALEM